MRSRCVPVNTRCRNFVTKTKCACRTKTQCLPVLISPCSPIGQWYDHGVRLRYNFRLYPTAGQRQALARAFGCARTVFNDGLRLRQEAREQG
ncbi:helix-turn-helix domain-containing protein, partial [Nonomuraea coxensis]|uniref:helix-turn-helix domain-containing protein n=1 Tax=Nonomuraea coxensis TaxID=404386 RepID=UPI003D159A43